MCPDKFMERGISVTLPEGIILSIHSLHLLKRGFLFVIVSEMESFCPSVKKKNEFCVKCHKVIEIFAVNILQFAVMMKIIRQ